MDYELLSNGKVQIGGRAPEFSCNSTCGNVDVFSGNQWFALFSYKEDFYPVSTSEFIFLEKNRGLFDAEDVKLVGMSMGTLLSHYAWVNDIYKKIGIKINFPIIEDPIGEVCRKYGMISKEVNNNFVTNNVVIIDNNGVVRTILEYPPEIERNIYEVIRIIKRLKESDVQNSLPK